MNNRSTKSSRLGKSLSGITLLALLLALPIAAFLDSGRVKTELRTSVDSYVVDLSFPTPPRSSDDNAVVVKLSTASGTPAPGATVTVVAAPQTGQEGNHGGGAKSDAQGGHAMPKDNSGGAMNMDGTSDNEMSGMDHEMPSGDQEMSGMDHEMPSGDQEMSGMDHEMPSGDHEKSGHAQSAKQTESASAGTALRPVGASGVYKGLVSIGADNTSRVAVNFALKGTKRTASFEVNTESRRPRALAFGGFAATNLLILIGAVIVGSGAAGDRRRAAKRVVKSQSETSTN